MKHMLNNLKSILHIIYLYPKSILNHIDICQKKHQRFCAVIHHILYNYLLKVRYNLGRLNRMLSNLFRFHNNTKQDNRNFQLFHYKLSVNYNLSRSLYQLHKLGIKDHKVHISDLSQHIRADMGKHFQLLFYWVISMLNSHYYQVHCMLSMYSYMQNILLEQIHKDHFSKRIYQEKWKQGSYRQGKKYNQSLWCQNSLSMKYHSK